MGQLLLQPSVAKSGEDETALLRQDMTAVMDALNQGFNPSTIPNNSIFSNQLKLLSVTNFGFSMVGGGGTVGDNDYQQAVLNITSTFGAPANVKGYNTFISTAQADLFVNPTGITPTTPHLGAALYTDNTPFGPASAAVAWSGAVLMNSVPVSPVNSMQRYMFDVLNNTGAPATFYISFSLLLIGTALVATA